MTQFGSAIHGLTNRSIPVEIGCTSNSAKSWSAALGGHFFIDADLNAYAMSAREAVSLGSQFVRAGTVYATPPFESPFDVGASDAAAIEEPGHPFLHDATTSEIRRLPPLPFPGLMQLPDVEHALVIADAPIKGLIELCFAVRGGWTFLEDCMNGASEAALLLDWAAESLCLSYASMLRATGRETACVIYRDDFGTPVGPYFSRSEHEKLVLPRIARVFEAIRAVSDAPIAVTIAGSCLDLLPSLRDQGCTVVGVDPHAQGMIATDLRRRLGKDAILYRTADLVALGAALNKGDMQSVAILTCELAAAMPVIAAPVRPADDAALDDLSRASAYLAALDPDDLATLAEVGPERAIIERAAAQPSHLRAPSPLRVVASDFRGNFGSSTIPPLASNVNDPRAPLFLNPGS